jgi:hypothetical protein
MLVVKPLTFELRGLQFTLIGSNSSWNIFNGSAEEEGVTARPLSPLLVIELPSELKNFRRPTRNGEPLPSASIPGTNSTQGN